MCPPPQGRVRPQPCMRTSWAPVVDGRTPGVGRARSSPRFTATRGSARAVSVHPVKDAHDQCICAGRCTPCRRRTRWATAGAPVVYRADSRRSRRRRAGGVHRRRPSTVVHGENHHKPLSPRSRTRSTAARPAAPRFCASAWASYARPQRPALRPHGRGGGASSALGEGAEAAGSSSPRRCPGTPRPTPQQSAPLLPCAEHRLRRARRRPVCS